MKKLNLPVSNESFPPAPVLTMDQYLEFSQMCWDHIVDKKRYLKSKTGVRALFVLKASIVQKKRIAS